ncbi:Uncharacterized protein dnm_069180 [Desulfonema magnum]|uniref:Uncharacterized protein n=1 Tax=Desulfonema magnum TaxID=45655 RepID=A0A975BSH4_9BACT|nr:Uncharacterized protein dnm_069180 [Desulfonema magnum]
MNCISFSPCHKIYEGKFFFLYSMIMFFVLAWKIIKDAFATRIFYKKGMLIPFL